MKKDAEEAMADIVSTLLLADHMGDAHEAGMTAARFLWGKEGEREYLESANGGRATARMVELLRERIPSIWGRDD